MEKEWLQSVARGVKSLHALTVIAMPDCLLYSAWQREEKDLELERVAGYLGDLTRANRQALSALGSWSANMQVTIETVDALILLREIDANFVCASIFERDTPLGMVRLQLSQVVESLRDALPKIGGDEIPRGVRILRFLERYAPDAHMITQRLAVRLGFDSTKLARPEKLTAEECDELEAEARNLLGIDRLAL